MVTDEEAARKVAETTGLPPKAAAWTAFAALHSGVFLQSQCTAWCGDNNPSTRKSSSRIVSQMLDPDRNICDELPLGGYPRIVHVRHHSVYRALGEPDNRNRRRAAPDKVLERLLGLDYVLEHRSERWLPTEEAKTDACRAAGIRATAWPRKDYLPTAEGSNAGRAVRHFVEKWPLALDPPGRRAVITVVAPGTTLSRLNTWRRDYEELVRQCAAAGMRPHLAHISNRPGLTDKAQARLGALVRELAEGDPAAAEIGRIKRAIMKCTDEAAEEWGGWRRMLARSREIHAKGGPGGVPPVEATAEAWLSERVRPERARGAPA